MAGIIATVGTQINVYCVGSLQFSMGLKKKNIKNAPRIILTFGQQEIISLFDSIF